MSADALRHDVVHAKNSRARVMPGTQAGLPSMERETRWHAASADPIGLSARLALRQRPRGPAVMKQRWAQLLFLHWRMDPDLLRPLVPEGLHLDLYEGDAWIGIVPFQMQRIRPSYLPPLPWISWFSELNVRIYCHDDRGTPGVWFLSLDCSQPVAVELGRHLFRLPYEHARIRADYSAGSRFSCLRNGETGEARYDFTVDGPAREAAPGTLEFFLLERYLLFAGDKGGRLYSGQVHHPPYRWRVASCTQASTVPFAWNDLPMPDGPPESALWAQPVDVDVFGLLPLSR